MHIILASQSQRRQQILNWIIGDNLTVQPAHLNEEAFGRLARTPDELVEKLAIAKAKKIGDTTPESIVIAADTAVIINPDQDYWLQIGKPKGEEDASNILKSLRGKSHFVFTGTAVYNAQSQKLMSAYTKTEVTFKAFSDASLEFYIKTNEWIDKAGAYNIYDREDDFIEKIDGSYTNIMGLPAGKAVELLKDFGVKLNREWKVRVKKETGHED